jgi:23S rRNA (guanosine2251-2'-O)-methyltransferase
MKMDSIQIVALETVSSATAPEDADIQFPCAILVGNERFGLDSNILAEADLIVKIPVYGEKNSLNVVSAFSIFAYEIRKQWQRIRPNK